MAAVHVTLALMLALPAPAALLTLAALGGCQTQPDPAALAAEQERARRRAELLTQARDTRLDITARRRAVETLLVSGQREAYEQLVSELYASNDPAAQQAIAQAIANGSAKPLPMFRPPLFNLLERVDGDAWPAVQLDVAAALGRYDDPKLADQLIKVAQDSSKPLNFRRGAALTLGYFRDQSVAKVLMDLIQIDLIRNPNPPALRQAAFDGLALLSGITAYGADADRWKAWWDEHRRLSREQFLARLVVNFASRNDTAASRSEQTQARLIEVQRQLYRAAPADDRPRVLAAMLADPIDATRQLAMDLMLQRLIDNEPTTLELREALLSRLGDPLSLLRQRAALLLREMRSEPAADTVADRLAAGSETDAGVVKAYLLLVTRLPREKAVAPALAMLGNAELRPEAAGALAAAVDQGLLTGQQMRAAAAAVRRPYAGHDLPEPAVVTLLGRVGEASDWNHIEAWLDAPDPAVKQAAAQVWARSDRPLLPLAQRAGDPVIRDIVIDAAAQRGNDPATLDQLLDHQPNLPQPGEAWRRALIAMAGRVPARAALAAAHRLAALNETPAFREQFLSAAVAAAHPDNDLVDLLLVRAAARLAADPTLALADYQRIAAMGLPLSGDQKDRFDRGLLQARLATGDLAGAFELARNILGNTAPRADTSDTDAMVTWFLDSAQRAAAAGRPEQARSVLAQVRILFGPAISDRLRRSLADVEARLPTQPATPPTATAEKPQAPTPAPAPGSAPPPTP
jgi:hypothetical protein